MKTSLLGLSCDEIAELINVPQKFRARQLYNAFYTGRKESFDVITDIPLSLRKELSDKFAIYTAAVDTVLEDDGNKKIRLKLQDGLYTESVLLQDGTGRQTICISSQCGCKMGCRFCRTADMGFQRNLTSGEILEQFMLMEKLAGKISNIVFMGMGEPFDNRENLFRAITILNDPKGICLGSRKMTVSTCGLVDGIRTLADYRHEIRLAVSLNSAIEEKRRQIMPITNRYSLKELKDALLYYQQQTGKRFTFEYVLIADFNIGAEDAKALIDFISGLSVLVNLIPWNTVEGKPFTTPDRQAIMDFCRILDRADVNYTLRKKKGFGISGACGQLAYKGKKQDK